MPASARIYRLTPLAEADLEQIWLYTSRNWSPEQADTYLAGIMAAFAGLAAGNRKGRPVLVREGYLKYAVGSHLVFYRESDTTMDVIRILHQRMDVENYL